MEAAFFLADLIGDIANSPPTAVDIATDATVTSTTFTTLFTPHGDVDDMGSHRADSEIITIDSDDDDLEVKPYLTSTKSSMSLPSADRRECS